MERWRPLVQWLLAWPYLVIAGVLYWLTGLLTIVAFFTVLFTKQIPRECRADDARPALDGPRQRLRLLHDEAVPPFIWG